MGERSSDFEGGSKCSGVEDHCHGVSLVLDWQNSHTAAIRWACTLHCIHLLEMWRQLLPVAHSKEISMWPLLCAFEIWCSHGRLRISG